VSLISCIFCNHTITWAFAGIGCPAPSLPPDGTNLETASTVFAFLNFSDTIKYKCKDGFFFHESVNIIEYTVTCLSDGKFTDTPMKHCVHPEGRSF
jgi:hypothetical protein